MTKHDETTRRDCIRQVGGGAVVAGGWQAAAVSGWRLVFRSG